MVRRYFGGRSGAGPGIASARAGNPGSPRTSGRRRLRCHHYCGATVATCRHRADRRRREEARPGRKTIGHDGGGSKGISDRGPRRGHRRDVGSVYLFHPVTREISRRIRSGETGGVRFMSASRMFTRLASSQDRPDVNTLWDLAPNDLAMFVEFAGSVPERVFCAGSAFFRPDLADAAFAILEFPGKVIAELRASWDYPFRERLVTVVGGLETLRFDDDAGEKLLRYAGPPIDLAGRRGEPLRCDESPALREQIRHSSPPCGRGVSPRLLELGARIVRILEALSESAAAGSPVHLA